LTFIYEKESVVINTVYSLVLTNLLNNLHKTVCVYVLVTNYLQYLLAQSLLEAQ
jgi:hypothetical protein